MLVLNEAVNDFIVDSMKSSPTVSITRKRGRPLSFDRDAALDKAMLLFWRHGYEGTSLNDLTTTMGVTPPSLYTAFGDKKRLFLEAVNRYLSGPVTSEMIIDEARTARDAASGLLRAAAVGFTGAATPAGCLLASSAISGSAAAADVQAELAALRRGIEVRLRQKIVDAIETGEMAAGIEPDALAGHVMSVIQGMSTLARDGATRLKLLAIGELAMRAWPTDPSRRESRVGAIGTSSASNRLVSERTSRERQPRASRLPDSRIQGSASSERRAGPAAEGPGSCCPPPPPIFR